MFACVFVFVHVGLFVCIVCVSAWVCTVCVHEQIPGYHPKMIGFSEKSRTAKRMSSNGEIRSSKMIRFFEKRCSEVAVS